MHNAQCCLARRQRCHLAVNCCMSTEKVFLYAQTVALHYLKLLRSSTPGAAGRALTKPSADQSLCRPILHTVWYVPKLLAQHVVVISDMCLTTAQPKPLVSGIVLTRYRLILEEALALERSRPPIDWQEFVDNNRQEDCE